MVDRLERERFLAVLGASGSGKSSLVKVGLVEALERGDMQSAGRRWRIVQFTPNGRPMYELAKALLGKSASLQQIELMVAFLRRGPRSLLEWCESGQLKPDENLLVFVDQFEELFRYRNYAGREEAEAFVALMLRTKNTRRLPVYVALTMRSEFLGACAMIEDLAQAMNDGQFLTPQMNCDQCHAAIVGPSRISDFDVEPALVNRILNDLAIYSASDEHPARETDDGSTFSDVSSQSDRIARQADQLPLLQHALNGLYNWARSQSPSGPIVLRLKDYETWDGLQGSLNRHADNILAEVEKALGEERAQKVCANLFRALVSGTSIADAQRRPVRLSELVKLCSNDEAAVRVIVEAFRRKGRDFLRPDPSKPLDANSIIDITHESLIRQWSKLAGWLDAEVEDAQSWRRLADAAAEWHEGKGELLRGPGLQRLSNWRREAKPTAEWAERYGATANDFKGAIRFLERSRYAKWARGAAYIGSILAVCALLGWQAYADINRRREAAATQVANALEQARIKREAADELTKAADELTKAAEKVKEAGERETRLAQSAKGRTEKQAKLSNELFGTSSQLFITTDQRNGAWEGSGAFIASLIDATPNEIQPQILKPLQGRMVAQYAFRPPLDELGGIEIRTDTRGNYRLSVAAGRSRAMVIDARTKAVHQEFDLSEWEPVDRRVTHSISPDGNQALLVLTESGSVDGGQPTRTTTSRIVLATVRPNARSPRIRAGHWQNSTPGTRWW